MNSIPSIKNESKHTRIISAFLLTVLFSQEIVSFSYACDSLKEMNSPFLLSESSVIFNESSNTARTKKVQIPQKGKGIKVLQKVSKGYNGPGQSETSGFSLNSTDGMVDKFTGDFSYSIPLMDVEGYPITLSYNSNVGMNTEASWVGLGWDLNVGAISREMRGIPDEFNGNDVVERTFNQKENTVDGHKIGGYAAPGFTIKKMFIQSKISATLLGGWYKDSYVGKGGTFDMSLAGSLSIPATSDGNLSINPSVSIGYSVDTKNGISRNTNYGLSAGFSAKNTTIGGNVSFGKSFNSRHGMVSKSWGLGLQAEQELFIHSVSGDLGASSTITYGTLTSIPRVMINSKGTSTSSNLNLFLGSKKMIYAKSGFRAGLEFIDYHVTSGLDIENNKVYQPAYGFLHSGKRANYQGSDYPIMDYNRSADFAYSEQMKNLAFSIQTYDVFHVSAMGISGTFRPRRSDFGTYYDPEAKNQMNNPVDGLQGAGNPSGENIEVGITLAKKHPGFNRDFSITLNPSVNYQNSEVESANWKDGNSSNVLEFDPETGSNTNPFDKSVYFKAVGETTPENSTAYEMLGGAVANNLQVTKDDEDESIILTNNLMTSAGVVNSSDLNAASGRPIISTYFQPKTAEEMLLLSNSNYKSYSLFQSNLPYTPSTNETLNRVGAFKKPNHISAVEIVSSDGLQYTYGIPVYNVNNSEVSFAVEATSVDEQGLVAYNYEGTYADNSPGNQNGMSNYYDKTVVPAYAHSYLLTEMKSSDYVDRSGNGLSVDDIGSYYKINHTCVYGNISKPAYKWRYPMSGTSIPKAIYSQGMLGTKLDDMAHYTYGEKEIWYTQSIESKNMVAEFYLEDRFDAYGVSDENGILDENQPLKRLHKIVLYNRSDRQQNGVNAIPLQTIEFEYNYSLCKGAPANKYTYTGSAGRELSGKLTLIGIRVYSGKSEEMGLSKYEFTYPPEPLVNAEQYDFNYQNVDAWGNFKENNINKPNDLFPYAEQNVSTANNNAKLWKLIGIKNPMGGKIEITYESDQYGYVQDKRAMRHFDIYRMTNLIEFLDLKEQNSWDGTSSAYSSFTKDLSSDINILDYLQMNKYNQQFGKFDQKFVPNNVVIFKLDTPIDVSNIPVGVTVENYVDQQVKERYFKDPTQSNSYLEELYFKTKVKLKSDNSNQVYELVPCFASISDDYTNAFGNLVSNDNFKGIGAMPPTDDGYQYGYVVLDPVNSGEIEKAGKKGSGEDKNGLLMNPIQRAALDYVRQNLPDQVYGSCDGCDTDLSIDWKVIFGGDMYAYMIGKGGYLPEFVPASSTLRLFEADNEKLGGSSRVSQIKYLDNWDVISTEYNSEYLWTYSYKDEGTTTGVASFEQRSTIDENPLYQWDAYVNFAKKFPDETKFTPTPVAEALFPSGSIGYERVVVQFAGNSNKGYSVSKFHTAKESKYITKAEATPLNSSQKLSKNRPIKGTHIDLFGLSQGYSVETNDFHGKPDQTELYDGQNNIQSRSTYRYYELGEKVRMLDRNGNMTFENIAQEFDIHADSRYISSRTEFTTIGIGVEVIFVGMNNPPLPPPVGPLPPYIFGGIMPGPVFSRSTSDNGFYSHTLIKHINRSAVLKGIETQYMASVNKAENLVYDKHTGNVLLSSLNDEYNDKLFSMSYPSHWYYPNLRDLTGVITTPITGEVTDGVLDVATTNPTINLSDIYSPGDLLNVSGSTAPVWVLDVKHSLMTLINQNGTLYGGAGTTTVSLKKSNRKNRLNETMQNIVTKKAPLNPNGTEFTFPINQIISSGAIVYGNKKTMRCGDGDGKPHGIVNYEVQANAPVNPFLFGNSGNIVVDKQFTWQGKRINDQHDHGVRFDGTYMTFTPFYRLNPTDHHWYQIKENNHPMNIPTNPYQRWREQGNVTVYDEFGKPMESKDPLRIYSAVLYGYNNSLNIIPVAQAVNAKQQDIAFDGFEDYGYYPSVNLNNDQTHFDFKGAINTSTVTLNSANRHSGLNSLRIAPSTTAQVNKNVSNCIEPIALAGPDNAEEVVAGSQGGGVPPKGGAGTYNELGQLVIPDNLPTESTEVVIDNDIKDTPFQISDCNCIKPFEPTPGEYIVSVWVREDDSKTKETFTAGQVNIVLDGTPISFLPTGKIIDGWQRLEGNFTILPTTASIVVQLENVSTSTAVYFDDIRIHPFLAGMKTIVYDPKTLLPLASHDGYNFTTFFNYDENLNQVRVKVETEEGIKTVSESEFGGQKSYKED